MPRYRLQPQAEADLEGIGDYIALDSPSRALAFVERLREACQRLAETPGMGVARDTLQAGLRMFPVHGYLIFYFPAADGIEAVRVLSSARDVDAMW